MLKESDYRNLAIEFPFMFGYAGIWLELLYDSLFIHTNVLYNFAVKQKMSGNHSIGWSASVIANMWSFVKKFKTFVWCLFGSDGSQGLNKLQFHLLDHIVDNLNRHGNILLLSGTSYENRNLYSNCHTPLIRIV